MLENDVVRGQTRNYYSVRLILICLTSAAVFAAIISAGVSLLLADSVNDTLYRGAVKACNRGNEVRVESNRRIPAHALDRDNLQILAKHLSKNRAKEAAAFAGINGLIESFGTSPLVARVDRLVDTLRQASSEDQAVADSQATVQFSPLRIIPCEDERYVPRP